MKVKRFDVYFEDDCGGTSNISVYASDEGDAREQIGRCLFGRRGSGTFRLVTERRGFEYFGEATPFQIGRGDTQDGDAA